MSINKSEMLQRIVFIMKSKGFWDTIMHSNSEMDRVKIFLSRLAGEPYPEASIAPRIIPSFPGLNHQPVHDSTTHPWTSILTDSFESIREELYELNMRPTFTDYKTNNALSAGIWDIFAFYYNGIIFPEIEEKCPKTFSIIESLPRHCQRYPYGVAVFSKLHPGSHIAPHRSIDNIRVRGHLGITIPEGCKLRVDNQILYWKEGTPIYFEDYFEHEVWHQGTETRIVLIVDTWHPDLTDLEIEALTAAFRQPEIMSLIHQTRITPFQKGGKLEKYFLDAFINNEHSDLLIKYWN